MGLIFNGGYKDFSAEWFDEIGNTMVAAMIFNVYWPLLEFFAFYGMRLGFRLLDRNFGCNEYNTKKTTLQQFVELYSGPVYFIHYKYSAILNITFVTFLYGLGLPILFPIAAFSFFTLYVVEKTMIFYSYRQPPVYDDLLNKNALETMKWAPLGFLAFGYWMFSSPQLMGNTLGMLDKTSTVMDSNHVWWEAITGEGYQLGPGLPLILMFWILLILIIFRLPLYNLLRTCCPSFIKVGEMELDEDIDNYFACLDDHDRNWSLKEEENSRKVLGMNILTDETVKKL